MGVPVIAHRIIVAVQPRLLADALVRALARTDVDVVITLDPAPVERSQFDIAVVTGDLPAGVEAEVVIQLPHTDPPAAGSITTANGTEPAAFGDLTTLLKTLDRYLDTV